MARDGGRFLPRWHCLACAHRQELGKWTSTGERDNAQAHVSGCSLARSDDMPLGQPGFHHSVCVADFNDDGRLDLLLGDTFRRVSENQQVEDPQLPTDYKEGLAILSAQHSQLRREKLQEAPPTARIAHHRAALRAWQKYEQLRIAGSAARGSHPRNSGFVWYFQRIAP